MPLPYKKGSNGPEIGVWYDWAHRYAKSYADKIGARDLYYGLGEEDFTKTLQGKLGIPATGIFDELTAKLVGYKVSTNSGGTVVVPTKPAERRKIWMLTNPGSGANEFQGPSFQLGERIKRDFNINHQPVNSLLGGYLGFMGGDPKYSYVDVTWSQFKSIEYLLDHNPDINDKDLELWFSGYSQKADGLEDALEILFGDGGFVHPGDPSQKVWGPGKYRHLRNRINGVIQFGNPSTKTTGIARKVRPQWLYDLVHNINYDNDFYAVAKDKIRPPMYAIIIKAEMELPFFVHVMKLAMKIIPKFLPIIGGIAGPLAPLIIAGAAGMSSLSGLLGGIMGQASAADEAVDAELEKLLSVEGLITGLPDIIGLIGALPGLQAHGGYEFDPVKMDQAWKIVADYRR